MRRKRLPLLVPLQPSYQIKLIVVGTGKHSTARLHPEPNPLWNSIVMSAARRTVYLAHTKLLPRPGEEVFVNRTSHAIISPVQ
jgi:hypothetical protein